MDPGNYELIRRVQKGEVVLPSDLVGRFVAQDVLPYAYVPPSRGHVDSEAGPSSAPRYQPMDGITALPVTPVRASRDPGLPTAGHTAETAPPNSHATHLPPERSVADGTRAAFGAGLAGPDTTRSPGADTVGGVDDTGPNSAAGADPARSAPLPDSDVVALRLTAGDGPDRLADRGVSSPQPAVRNPGDGADRAAGPASGYTGHGGVRSPAGRIQGGASRPRHLSGSRPTREPNPHSSSSDAPVVDARTAYQGLPPGLSGLVQRVRLADNELSDNHVRHLIDLPRRSDGQLSSRGVAHYLEVQRSDWHEMLAALQGHAGVRVEGVDDATLRRHHHVWSSKYPEVWSYLERPGGDLNVLTGGPELARVGAGIRFDRNLPMSVEQVNHRGVQVRMHTFGRDSTVNARRELVLRALSVLANAGYQLPASLDVYLPRYHRMLRVRGAPGTDGHTAPRIRSKAVPSEFLYEGTFARAVPPGSIMVTALADPTVLSSGTYMPAGIGIPTDHIFDPALGVVLHELMHWRHASYVPRLFADLTETEFLPAAGELAGAVSPYAATNPYEFVAEYRLGELVGQHYNPGIARRLAELDRVLGGPLHRDGVGPGLPPAITDDQLNFLADQVRRGRWLSGIGRNEVAFAQAALGLSERWRSLPVQAQLVIEAVRRARGPEAPLGRWSYVAVDFAPRQRQLQAPTEAMNILAGHLRDLAERQRVEVRVEGGGARYFSNAGMDRAASVRRHLLGLAGEENISWHAASSRGNRIAASKSPGVPQRAQQAMIWWTRPSVEALRLRDGAADDDLDASSTASDSEATDSGSSDLAAEHDRGPEPQYAAADAGSGSAQRHLDVLASDTDSASAGQLPAGSRGQRSGFDQRASDVDPTGVGDTVSQGGESRAWAQPTSDSERSSESAVWMGPRTTPYDAWHGFVEASRLDADYVLASAKSRVVEFGFDVDGLDDVITRAYGQLPDDLRSNGSRAAVADQLANLVVYGQPRIGLRGGSRPPSDQRDSWPDTALGEPGRQPLGAEASSAHAGPSGHSEALDDPAFTVWPPDRRSAYQQISPRLAGLVTREHVDPNDLDQPAYRHLTDFVRTHGGELTDDAVADFVDRAQFDLEGELELIRVQAGVTVVGTGDDRLRHLIESNPLLLTEFPELRTYLERPDPSSQTDNNLGALSVLEETRHNVRVSFFFSESDPLAGPRQELILRALEMLHAARYALPANLNVFLPRYLRNLAVHLTMNGAGEERINITPTPIHEDMPANTVAWFRTPDTMVISSRAIAAHPPGRPAAHSDGVDSLMEDVALGTVLRELMHWVHFGYQPALYVDAEFTALLPRDLRLVDTVSRYAQDHAREFVAEYGLSRLLGRRYDDARSAARLEQLYRGLGGQLPFRPAAARPPTDREADYLIRSVRQFPALAQVSAHAIARVHATLAPFDRWSNLTHRVERIVTALSTAPPSPGRAEIDALITRVRRTPGLSDVGAHVIGRAHADLALFDQWGSLEHRAELISRALLSDQSDRGGAGQSGGGGPAAGDAGDAVGGSRGGRRAGGDQPSASELEAMVARWEALAPAPVEPNYAEILVINQIRDGQIAVPADLVDRFGSFGVVPYGYVAPSAGHVYSAAGTSGGGGSTRPPGERGSVSSHPGLGPVVEQRADWPHDAWYPGEDGQSALPGASHLPPGALAPEEWSGFDPGMTPATHQFAVEGPQGSPAEPVRAGMAARPAEVASPPAERGGTPHSNAHDGSRTNVKDRQDLLRRARNWHDKKVDARRRWYTLRTGREPNLVAEYPPDDVLLARYKRYREAENLRYNARSKRAAENPRATGGDGSGDPAPAGRPKRKRRNADPAGPGKPRPRSDAAGGSQTNSEDLERQRLLERAKNWKKTRRLGQMQLAYDYGLRKEPPNWDDDLYPSDDELLDQYERRRAAVRNYTQRTRSKRAAGNPEAVGGDGSGEPGRGGRPKRKRRNAEPAGPGRPPPRSDAPEGSQTNSEDLERQRLLERAKEWKRTLRLGQMKYAYKEGLSRKPPEWHDDLYPPDDELLASYKRYLAAQNLRYQAKSTRAAESPEAMGGDGSGDPGRGGRPKRKRRDASPAGETRRATGTSWPDAVSEVSGGQAASWRLGSPREGGPTVGDAVVGSHGGRRAGGDQPSASELEAMVARWEALAPAPVEPNHAEMLVISQIRDGQIAVPAGLVDRFASFGVVPYGYVAPSAGHVYSAAGPSGGGGSTRPRGERGSGPSPSTRKAHRRAMRERAAKKRAAENLGVMGGGGSGDAGPPQKRRRRDADLSGENRAAALAGSAQQEPSSQPSSSRQPDAGTSRSARLDAVMGVPGADESALWTVGAGRVLPEQVVDRTVALAVEAAQQGPIELVIAVDDQPHDVEQARDLTANVVLPVLIDLELRNIDPGRFTVHVQRRSHGVGGPRGPVVRTAPQPRPPAVVDPQTQVLVDEVARELADVLPTATARIVEALDNPELQAWRHDNPTQLARRVAEFIKTGHVGRLRGGAGGGVHSSQGFRPSGPGEGPSSAAHSVSEALGLLSGEQRVGWRSRPDDRAVPTLSTGKGKQRMDADALRREHPPVAGADLGRRRTGPGVESGVRDSGGMATPVRQVVENTALPGRSLPEAALGVPVAPPPPPLRLGAARLVRAGGAPPRREAWVGLRGGKDVLADESWRHSLAGSAPWFEPQDRVLPDRWTAKLEAAPAYTVDAVVADVAADSTPGRIGWYRGVIRYDWQRIGVGDGRFVQVYRLRIHLRAADGVSAGTLAEVQANARAGIDQLANQGFRLPSGDQFHVDVQFVTSPAEAHTSIEVAATGSDQTHWNPQMLPGVLAHEILHYLGVPDESQDARRVFLRHATNTGVHRGDGSVMSDDVHAGGGLRPRHLWLIERVATSQLGVAATNVADAGVGASRSWLTPQRSIARPSIAALSTVGHGVLGTRPAPKRKRTRPETDDTNDTGRRVRPDHAGAREDQGTPAPADERATNEQHPTTPAIGHMSYKTVGKRGTIKVMKGLNLKQQIQITIGRAHASERVRVHAAGDVVTIYDASNTMLGRVTVQPDKTSYTVRDMSTRILTVGGDGNIVLATKTMKSTQTTVHQNSIIHVGNRRRGAKVRVDIVGDDVSVYDAADNPLGKVTLKEDVRYHTLHDPSNRTLAVEDKGTIIVSTMSMDSAQMTVKQKNTVYVGKPHKRERVQVHVADDVVTVYDAAGTTKLGAVRLRVGKTRYSLIRDGMGAEVVSAAGQASPGVRGASAAADGPAAGGPVVVRVPGDGWCLLYAVLVGMSPRHWPAGLGSLSTRADVLGELGVGEGAGRGGAGGRAAQGSGRPALMGAAQGLHRMVVDWVQRVDTAGFPGDVVEPYRRSPEQMAAVERFVSTASRQEVVAWLAAGGIEEVQDPAWLSPQMLRARYLDVRTRELSQEMPAHSGSGLAPMAMLSATATARRQAENEVMVDRWGNLTEEALGIQAQFEYLQNHRALPAVGELDTESLGRTARETWAHRPLTAAEHHGLIAALNDWQPGSAGWNTSYGEMFPALVAHTLNVRLRNVMTNGVQDVGPSGSGRVVQVSYNGHDHYDAIVAAGHDSAPPAHTPVRLSQHDTPAPTPFVPPSPGRASIVSTPGLDATAVAAKQEGNDPELPPLVRPAPTWIHTGAHDQTSDAYVQLEPWVYNVETDEWEWRPKRDELGQIHRLIASSRIDPIEGHDLLFPLRDPEDPLHRVHHIFADHEGNVAPEVGVQKVKLNFDAHEIGLQDTAGPPAKTSNPAKPVRKNPAKQGPKSPAEQVMGSLAQEVRADLTRLIENSRAGAQPLPSFLSQRTVTRKVTEHDPLPDHEQGLIGQYGLFIRPERTIGDVRGVDGHILGFYMGGWLRSRADEQRVEALHPNYRHYLLEINQRSKLSGLSACNGVVFANTPLLEDKSGYDDQRANADYFSCTATITDNQGNPRTIELSVLIGRKNLKPGDQVWVSYGPYYLPLFDQPSPAVKPELSD
ncbi:hypothetical protein [Mycobacterium sp. 1245801.1]|uniref:hypothetical protein n=1 Tax=Mycobacterium sp. 1245801.1 TaxID=1834075 RepID=UPI0012E9CEBE|nr:hypothetical protein [Mycobacterium sp. 1245801.1]